MWAGLLATTPLLLDHATLGNADLLFAIALTLGVLGLCYWLRDGARRVFAGGVIGLGMAAWIKPEGIYIGIALISIAGLIGTLVMQPARRLTTALTVCGGMAALALMYLPWVLFAQHLQLTADAPTAPLLAVTGLTNLWRGITIIGEEMLFSHNNSTWGLLGGGFNLLWPVCAGAIVLSVRRGRRDAVLAFLVTSVICVIAFYAAVYIVRPFFSVERYLLHAAPIAFLAAARVTRSR